MLVHTIQFGGYIIDILDILQIIIGLWAIYYPLYPGACPGWDENP